MSYKTSQKEKLVEIFTPKHQILYSMYSSDIILYNVKSNKLP